VHYRSTFDSLSVAVGRVAGCVALAALVLAPAQVTGQYTSSPSILTLLPVEATLSIGEEHAAELTSDDFEYTGELVKAFAMDGEQGAPVTIDVLSESFDSYAYLIGPDGLQLEADDDSGGACNARISTFFPQDGRYLIVAASLTGEAGAFTIRTDDRQHPPAEGPCGGGEYEDDMLATLAGIEASGAIAVGESVADELRSGDARLADGSFAKAYELAGTPGQTVVVDLGSRAFDTLLLILDPRGEAYSSDDDSGGACNSRIEVTLDMQPHKLVVTSFGSDATGLFTLSVSEEAGPMSQLDCPGLEATTGD